MPAAVAEVVTSSSGMLVVVGGEYANRVNSGDERDPIVTGTEMYNVCSNRYNKCNTNTTNSFSCSIKSARALANLVTHEDSNNNNVAVGQEVGDPESLVQLTHSTHDGVRN